MTPSFAWQRMAVFCFTTCPRSCTSPINSTTGAFPSGLVQDLCAKRVRAVRAWGDGGSRKSNEDDGGIQIMQVRREMHVGRMHTCTVGDYNFRQPPTRDNFPAYLGKLCGTIASIFELSVTNLSATSRHLDKHVPMLQPMGFATPCRFFFFGKLGFGQSRDPFYLPIAMSSHQVVHTLHLKQSMRIVDLSFSLIE